MKLRKKETSTDIQDVAELKKLVAANAVAMGNTFAFHDLFSKLKEFGKGGDEAGVNETLLDHLSYLLPNEETAESQEFRSAMELVEKYELKGDTVPAALLEETAKEAIAKGKFAYAEDAYRLLGIKKEMVALYAQAGEQFLREDKPRHAGISFLIAAAIEQPIGPHFQYLGPELHAKCAEQPQTCVTSLSVDKLIDVAIGFLLANASLGQRLIASARPDQKPQVLGTLAAYRDLNLPELVKNLRAAVAALSAIKDGKPDDYSPIGSIILGRPTASNAAWQYLVELSFEHPVGSLCACLRRVRDKVVLVPVIRDGKSLIEILLPPEFLQ